MEWRPSPLHSSALHCSSALHFVEAPAESELASPKARLVSVDSEVDHLRFGRFQVIALLVLGLANASDAVELLCLSFILPLLTIDSGEALSSTSKAWLSSGVFLGMLVGGLVFGTLADALGRRTTLAVSLGINAAFGLLASASPRYEWLIVCRVLAGFGVGGSVPGVFSLGAELLPTLDRGFWLSTVAWWWMLGTIYTAGVAWVMLGSLGTLWQLFVAACALPAAAAAALVLLLLPESPRFLHTSGNAQGARAALLYMARVNRVESRLVKGWQLTPPPGVNALRELEAALSGGSTPLVRKAASPSSSSGGGSAGPFRACACSFEPVRAFFAPAHRRAAIALSVVWFTLSLGWYGLFSWLPQIMRNAGLSLDIYQDSFLVAAASLPGNVVSALLMERIGRRGVLTASLLLACFSAIAFPFANTAALAVFAACTLNAVSTCSWNALDVLSVESFPTSLRTTSVGMLAATGRVGSIVAQFIFASLVNVSLVALLCAAGAALGVGAVAAWLLPAEIKSAPLQDTTEEEAAAAKGIAKGGAPPVKEAW